MAEEKTVSPTVPEVKPEEAKESLGADDIQNLVKELKTIGVTTPEDVRGMARASSEAGNLARMLGEIRRENAELKNMLQNVSTQVPPRSTQTSWEPQPEGQTVDLGSLVEKSVWKVVNQIGEQQKQQNIRVQNELTKARSNPRYRSAEKEFEAALQNPDNQNRIISGEITGSELLAEVLLEQRDQLLAKTTAILGKLQPGAKSAPHVESGDTRSAPGPTTTDEKKRRLSDLEKQRTGGDADIEAALKVLLG